MMNKKKGLKIGNYRITPLGIGTILAILLVVIALILYPRLNLNRDTASNVLSNTSEPNASASNGDFSPDVGSDDVEVTPAPTARPTAAPTEEPKPREATIRLLGDITIETDLLRSAADLGTQSFDFSPMFSLILDSIGTADYTIANVNGTLGGTTTMPSGADKMITPVSLIDTLKDAGVDMIMAGGRYAFDGGLTELQGTLTNLEIAGIQALGINATQEDVGQPIIQDINGIQVAFFGYTETLNTTPSDKNALDCVNLISRRGDAVQKIQAAKENGADIIIVVVDWGTRYDMNLTKNQQTIASYLANAGADVIYGCGPSIVQPIVYMPDANSSPRTLCIGALGNLLSNQTSAGTNCGVILEIKLAEQSDGSIGVTAVQCVPTYVLRYQNASQTYQYRSLAIGQWLKTGSDDLLDGMSNADLQRMEQYWNNFSSYYGGVAEIIKE